MNKLLFALLLGGIVSLSACEKKEERILPKVGSTAQINVQEQSRVEHEEFTKQTQKELDELGLKLSELRKKAVVATGKAKEKLDQQVAALEQEQKIVQEKLVRLKSEIGEKWKELKDGVTRSIDQFRQSVKNAI